LAYQVKTVIQLLLAVLSAALAVGLCVSFIKLDEMLNVVPHLPAYAGEDDFSLRAAAFLGFVCPSFLLVGAILGWRASRHARQALRGWCGLIGGSAAVFLLTRLLAPLLLGLANTRQAANAVFVCILVSWVVMGSGSAWLLARRTR
jgi:hypothetical protein